MMLLKWFKPRDAAEAGSALADQFPRPPMPVSSGRGKQEQLRRAYGEALRDFLRRAVHDVGSLRLNFYKRAWFANSFKWRLLESGMDSQTASEWTHALVMAISSKGSRKDAA